VLVPLALSQLLANCAPAVGPVTMSAVVVYESGARPYAIGDNTARRSFFPQNRVGAEQLAGRLLREGHNIDVGYAQINSANFSGFGLDVHRAFEPCTNVSAGAAILQRAYASSERLYGAGQTALVHALSVYNTGGFWAGLGYARGVYATAAALRFEGAPFVAPGRRGPRAVPFHAAPRSRHAEASQ
jgi:type IV secretion system protein VirB1